VALGDADAVRRMQRQGRLKNEDWGRGALLSIAVKVNRIDMVSLLLDLGLDPNEPAEDDESVAGAGGHRGMFLSDDLTTQVGTLALVPQIVSAVKTPVIAAGGIADARGVAAALRLGACGAQVGTAYLLCPEATTSAVHRAMSRFMIPRACLPVNTFVRAVWWAASLFSEVTQEELGSSAPAAGTEIVFRGVRYRVVNATPPKVRSSRCDLRPGLLPGCTAPP
jgi:hypothetical protein